MTQRREKDDSVYFLQRFGPVTQKILLLLMAGVALSLTRRPDQYFRILRQIPREWEKVNHRTLRRSIKQLYQSKLVSCRERPNGTVSMVLTEEGMKRATRYHLEPMRIQRPVKWDKIWRVVIFDIPEDKQLARRALRRKLRHLGFYPFQKSVFIFPFECKKEIDFLVDFFDLQKHVRYFLAQKIDTESSLRRHFELSE